MTSEFLHASTVGVSNMLSSKSRDTQRAQYNKCDVGIP